MRPLLPWRPLGAGLQGALVPSAVALPFPGGPGPSFLSARGRPGSCCSWRGVPSGTHSRGPPPGQLHLQTPVCSQLWGRRCRQDRFLSLASGWCPPLSSRAQASVCACGPIASPSQATSCRALGPTHMTPRNLELFFKGPLSTFGHLLRSCGLGLRQMYFGGNAIHP